MSSGYLYWSDIGSKQICRAKLSEEPRNELVVIDSGLDIVDAIAVDVNGRLLYWTGAERLEETHFYFFCFQAIQISMSASKSHYNFTNNTVFQTLIKLKC